MEEGERHCAAEMPILRDEFELESLSAQAAEAERGEVAAALSASEPLLALQADIAAEERRLEEACDSEAARVLTPEEQHCREWCRMLVEDKKEHVGFAVLEEGCENMEHRLHELIGSASVGSGSQLNSSHGLDRLDAELHGIVGHSSQRASCRESLHKLAISEGRPWGPTWRDLYDAYTLIEQLRARNDNLCAEIANLRWQQSGQPLPTQQTQQPLSGGDAPQPPPQDHPRLVVTQPHLPQGPRFHAPALSQGKSKASRTRADDAAGERPVTGMPKAVLTDRQGWEAAAVERPFFSEEQGLGFMCKTTKQRFRPTISPPANAGFESAWGEEEAAAGAEFQSATLPRSAMNPAELARLTAAAFKEPLSSAVGAPRPAATAPLFPSRDARLRLDQERPRARAEWATFNGSNMVAPSLPGTAPGRLKTGGSHDSLGKREPSVPRTADAMDGWGMRQQEWDEQQWLQQPQQHRPQQLATSSSTSLVGTGRDEGNQEEAFHDLACQSFLATSKPSPLLNSFGAEAPIRSSSLLPNSFGPEAPSRSLLPNSICPEASNDWEEDPKFRTCLSPVDGQRQLVHDRQPPRELPPWPAWGGNPQQQQRQQQRQGPWT